MRTKLYHIPRLTPETEEKITKILRDGSDTVVQILHTHLKDYLPKKDDSVFEEILQIIAETVAKVAALQYLNYNHKERRRIAFLPGYINKKGKRITHKTKLEKGFIPSDIVFQINPEGEVEKVTEGISNQALLYYYLLEDHKDDDEFINGGTHQFLVTNAPYLKSKENYYIGLLQVYSGKKETKREEEVTFLTLEVDFNKLNTVEKLYKYFDENLNKNNSEYRWPLSIKDKKGDYKAIPRTYEMRGYLVALWYKVLHDPRKDTIDKWFADCIKLAESYKFYKLKARLQTLWKKIKENIGEHYTYWYSLLFNPLPDFAQPDKPIKETLGSAMFMTDFELKPQFFFWVQPWI